MMNCSCMCGGTCHAGSHNHVWPKLAVLQDLKDHMASMSADIKYANGTSTGSIYINFGANKVSLLFTAASLLQRCCTITAGIDW